MEIQWLLVVICIMAVIIAALIVKIRLLQISAEEIEKAFTDKLINNTNTLIGISCRDKYIRSLAESINIQLRQLREQRLRYQQGDNELKNAVTNISHDLRTPLTAICGYLDLLENEEKTETVERYISIIRNRTRLLTELTEELFKYSVVLSRENNLPKENVSVGAVLEECISVFYALFNEHGIIPDIRMPESAVICCLDKSSLARVFENLLNNVVKYSKGDLVITLSEYGNITFSNTSSILDEIQVGMLFDRFYTVENASKSTGLGLSIARTLVEQMAALSAQHTKTAN